jgi:hypothetical protein
MKTLSGTVKLAVFAVIGVLAVVTFRAFAQSEAPSASEPSADKAAFVLKIKKDTPVKDAEHFKQVLKQLNTKLYVIHIKHGGGKPEEDVNSGPNAKLDIKTDKVITAEVKGTDAAELTPIGVHVTVQIASQSPADIKKVLAEFP